MQQDNKKGKSIFLYFQLCSLLITLALKFYF